MELLRLHIWQRCCWPDNAFVDVRVFGIRFDFAEKVEKYLLVFGIYRYLASKVNLTKSMQKPTNDAAAINLLIIETARCEHFVRYVWSNDR